MKGNYRRVERLFLALTLVFLAYPLSAILARPDWGVVLRSAVTPTVRPDPEYLLLLVALVGTTITPYAQMFQQDAVVERGPRRTLLHPGGRDHRLRLRQPDLHLHHHRHRGHPLRGRRRPASPAR